MSSNCHGNCRLIDSSKSSYWYLSSGEPISIAKSDVSIGYGVSTRTAPIYVKKKRDGLLGGHYNAHVGNNYYMTCSSAYCSKLTKLNKHSKYRRFDGTEYIDTKSIKESVSVCGSGIKIK